MSCSRPESSDDAERDLVRRLVAEPHPLAARRHVGEAQRVGRGRLRERAARRERHPAFGRRPPREQRSHARAVRHRAQEVGAEHGGVDGREVALDRQVLAPRSVVARHEPVEQHWARRGAAGRRDRA
jgi:hypothetical protein